MSAKAQVGIRPRQAGGQIFEVRIREALRPSAEAHLQTLWATLQATGQAGGAAPTDAAGRIVALLRFYESEGAFAADADETARRRVQDMATIAAHLLGPGHWLVDLDTGRVSAVDDA